MIRKMFRYAKPVVRQASYGILHYVDTSLAYQQWHPRGGWDPDDMLSFTTKSVEKQRIRSEAFSFPDQGIDPDLLIFTLENTARRMAKFMHFSELVVDPEGIRLVRTGRFEHMLWDLYELRCYAWPIVEGVTYGQNEKD